MEKENKGICPYFQKGFCLAFNKMCVEIDKCNNKLQIEEKENEQK